jgi:hypothetical protein
MRLMYGSHVCLTATGDATNDFINENWRLVLREVGKPAFKALGLVIHTILTEVAQKVPYDELFSDTD